MNLTLETFACVYCDRMIAKGHYKDKQKKEKITKRDRTDHAEAAEPSKKQSRRELVEGDLDMHLEMEMLRKKLDAVEKEKKMLLMEKQRTSRPVTNALTEEDQERAAIEEDISHNKTCKTSECQ